ncbi:hypothetical protein K474DRAFT_576389 [Panus rudis PR-1116 ss-1]|nr:hypothetical protein K474DRAFT_576389 [Panus rudis PR-1116 ss-1]
MISHARLTLCQDLVRLGVSRGSGTSRVLSLRQIGCAGTWSWSWYGLVYHDHPRVLWSFRMAVHSSTVGSDPEVPKSESRRVGTGQLSVTLPRDRCTTTSTFVAIRSLGLLHIHEPSWSFRMAVYPFGPLRALRTQRFPSPNHVMSGAQVGRGGSCL